MATIAELPRLIAERETARKARARESWALRGMLAVVLTTYVWGLDKNGWGNPFYAAAAQAGAHDWKAFFFGSLDWSNGITVDKPPLAIWPVALSIRIFGLNTWSVLVPQALMGTATVGIVFATVRRVFPATVAFTAAVLCASTPVFFLMSRFNNPEPMTGLLTALGLFFAVRAAQDQLWRWYLLLGASFGLAFLAKEFQALLPVPAIGLGLLVFGSGALRQRLGRLGAAAGTMVLAGGWWIAIVDLIPTSSRPYVGGSISNNELELALNYNGAARLIPASLLGVGNSPFNPSQETPPYAGGIPRLFDANFAPENAWLLAAAIASVALLALYGRRLGGPLQRMLILAASSWFVLVWLLLSFMGSLLHAYYTYSLVLPECLVIALALRCIWLRSDALIGRLFGVFILGATAYLSVRIMQYSNAWGWWGPLLLTVLAANASVLWMTRIRASHQLGVWVAVIASLIAGPVATDVFTTTASVGGTHPVSGPIGNDPHSTSRMLLGIRTNGQPDWGPDVAYGVTPSKDLVELLAREGTGSGKWLAATYPAQDAAVLELSENRPVLSLGGWLGADPSPTLRQFQNMVANDDVEFFIDHPAVRALGLGKETSDIAGWVESTYRGEAVGNAIVYRLDRNHLR